MKRSNVGIRKRKGGREEGRKGGRKEKLFQMIGTLTTLRNCLSDLSLSDTRIKILMTCTCLLVPIFFYIIFKIIWYL